MTKKGNVAQVEFYNIDKNTSVGKLGEGGRGGAKIYMWEWRPHQDLRWYSQPRRTYTLGRNTDFSRRAMLLIAQILAAT